MASPSSPVFGELARLDILVAVPPDEEGTFLVRELRRTRASVRSLWPLPETLPDTSDVIFCELASGLPARLPWVPGNARAALVGVMPAQFSGDFDLLRTSAVDAVLHRPLTAHAVMTCLIIAWMRFSYERRLRQRIAKLEETLRAVRLVERAKAILVAKRNLNEDDAYRFMQRQAMERRVPIAVIASAIIDSQAILG
ncbi:MAG: ANTAR domain-containing protein [Acetobacteraceae bacterium]|nr:ANTAR domain-containing protein [Acetobacteraceae bacterium]HZV04884.1 ANTAR domain-containing protein [Gemmataceae bacterium]